MKILLYVCLSLAGLLLLWVLALCAKRKKKGFYGFLAYTYAHRGLHNSKEGIPENSLGAFHRAAQCGYGAELDVHLSKDGRLVVIHDESLLRTAGEDRNICDLTEKELSAYRLEGTEEPIPYLEQVLEVFRGKAPLVIEIKTKGSNASQLTEKVCRMLDEYPDVRYCIESFDPRVLVWLRKHRPTIIRGQLSCNFVRERNNLALPLAFLLTNLLGNFLTLPHFVAYKLEDRKNLSFRLCRLIWGVQEINWTITRQEDAKEASKDGRGVIFEHCRP